MNDRIITVKGSGNITVKPDLIIIIMELESIDYSYNGVMQIASTTIDSIKKSIEIYSIKYNNQLQINDMTFINMFEYHKYKFKPRDVIGYIMAFLLLIHLFSVFIPKFAEKLYGCFLQKTIYKIKKKIEQILVILLIQNYHHFVIYKEFHIYY